MPRWKGNAILGDHSTLQLDPVLLSLLLIGPLAVGYTVHRRSLRPWYERKTVEEKNAGRLPESAQPQPQPERVIP